MLSRLYWNPPVCACVCWPICVSVCLYKIIVSVKALAGSNEPHLVTALVPLRPFTVVLMMLILKSSM